MWRVILVFLITSYSSELLASINYDSLLVIARNTNKKEDFINIEAYLSSREHEYSTINGKKLILYCATKTKLLNFEFLHAQFKFQESIISTMHGDIGAAMRMVEEALSIFSKFHTLESARCYNSLGSMTASLGNYELALKYLQKAEDICSQFKDAPRYPFMHCDNVLVTAYIYSLSEDYQNALIYLDKALKLGQEINYWHNVNSAYLNVADVYRHQEKYKDAIDVAEKAIAISRAENSYNLLCIGQFRKGQIFYDIGNLDSSLYYYQIAEETGRQQGMNLRLLNIYSACSKIYVEKYKYRSAYEYQQKYIELSNLVHAKEKESRIEMMQIKFEVEEKISRINALAKEKDAEARQNKLLTLAIIITIAAFGLLIFIIFLIFNRYRLNREILLERNEKEMSKHQLTSLKSQMNPHFTFNALNSIQDLILKENTEDSYNYITKFAELIRKTLNHSSMEFIEIQAEFETLKLYLELEELRFNDDLNIEFETNNIRDILIPPLLIQPFIENSIKHGLFHKKGRKHLRISFSLRDNLICTISDNGIGRKSSNEIQKRRIKNHKSFAVNSIRERLKLLSEIYGDEIGITYVDIENESQGTGTTVIICMPFKRRPENKQISNLT